jgi:CRISPR/Cas system CMR-associated protein Cmr1 (group 7 of RAMP superfamily)
LDQEIKKEREKMKVIIILKNCSKPTRNYKTAEEKPNNEQLYREKLNIKNKLYFRKNLNFKELKK